MHHMIVQRLADKARWNDYEVAKSCMDLLGQHRMDAHLNASDGNVCETEISIRIATSESDFENANKLLNKMYAWRNYGGKHNLRLEYDKITFLAMVDSNVVGTLTLRLDSASGLAADTIFADEINEVRNTDGRTVCELSKLAFDTDLPSRRILASLFHVVFIYGMSNFSCTDLFIEVNPRHRRYYHAMLGFRPVGHLKTNPKVAAPSQLMWISVAEIAAQIEVHKSERFDNTSRSLYPLFLSASEEASVEERLVQLSSLRSTHAVDGPADLFIEKWIGERGEALVA